VIPESCPLWKVHPRRPVLTSPTGREFAMAHNRGDALRWLGSYFNELSKRAEGAPARLAAAHPILTDALDLLMCGVASQGEECHGSHLALYLAAVMYRVTWADLGVEVPRG